MIIRGVVVAGRGLGKTFGYPTANLDIEVPDGLERGVYTAHIELEGVERQALVVIGAVSEAPRLFEVHLLDWEGDLYGRQLLVDVLEKISDIETLGSDEELTEKIARDIAIARDYFLTSHPRS